jgi:hypothetical protein
MGAIEDIKVSQSNEGRKNDDQCRKKVKENRRAQRT